MSITDFVSRNDKKNNPTNDMFVSRGEFEISWSCLDFEVVLRHILDVIFMHTLDAAIFMHTLGAVTLMRRLDAVIFMHILHAVTFTHISPAVILVHVIDVVMFCIYWRDGQRQTSTEKPGLQSDTALPPNTSCCGASAFCKLLVGTTTAPHATGEKPAHYTA